RARAPPAPRRPSPWPSAPASGRRRRGDSRPGAQRAPRAPAAAPPRGTRGPAPPAPGSPRPYPPAPPFEPPHHPTTRKPPGAPAGSILLLPVEMRDRRDAAHGELHQRLPEIPIARPLHARRDLGQKREEILRPGAAFLQLPG